MLVPAGSIIPLAGDYKTSHISNPKELEVQVYHGSDGTFTLVEDDCSERRSAAVQRTRFTYELAETKGAVLRMEQVGENTGLIPAERTYQITIFGISEPESIDVRGGAEAKWEYKSQEAALYIEIGGQAIRRFEVRIGLADQEVVGQDKLQQVFAILQRAQIEYELKDKIFDAVAKGRDTAGILAALVEMRVEQVLYGAITEILTMDL